MRFIHFKDKYGRYIYPVMDITNICYDNDTPYELSINFRNDDIYHFIFKSPFRAKYNYHKITRQMKGA